jgi:hypothetical protein
VFSILFNYLKHNGNYIHHLFKHSKITQSVIMAFIWFSQRRAICSLNSIVRFIVVNGGLVYILRCIGRIIQYYLHELRDLKYQRKGCDVHYFLGKHFKPLGMGFWVQNPLRTQTGLYSGRILRCPVSINLRLPHHEAVLLNFHRLNKTIV